MLVRTEETLSNVLKRIKGFDRMTRSVQFSAALQVARFCGYNLHPAAVRRAIKKSLRGGL
ncbi:MAG: hypothetical protein PWQ39_495 [Thermacetogenium sp.]|nr:hypothetical protein [Thermacetogenium sp.]